MSHSIALPGHRVGKHVVGPMHCQLNLVKLGHFARAIDWSHSAIHRILARGLLAAKMGRRLANTGISNSVEMTFPEYAALLPGYAYGSGARLVKLPGCVPRAKPDSPGPFFWLPQSCCPGHIGVQKPIFFRENFNELPWTEPGRTIPYTAHGNFLFNCASKNSLNIANLIPESAS